MSQNVRILLGGLLLGLLGCGYGSGGKPRAVCTTGMVADLVRNVGGDHFKVVQLMGEGVDPHRYKPSPGDVTQLNSAAVIFYSGQNLEGKMADLFQRLDRHKPTCAVTADIPRELLLADEAGHHNDPHLWFDVSLWARCVDKVRAQLIEIDPEHADDYRENAREYRDRLEKLHKEVQKDLARIEKQRRVLVTAHDAFRYFGRAYDVEVRGIQGISTTSEAGVKEINDLVSFLTRNKIKAVFRESSVSQKNVQALIDGCANKGHKVKEGGELYSDAMGAPGTPEGTYEGMIRHNVRTIVEALGKPSTDKK